MRRDLALDGQRRIALMSLDWARVFLGEQFAGFRGRPQPARISGASRPPRRFNLGYCLTAEPFCEPEGVGIAQAVSEQ
jgi:hypothetical protein